jgi:hypothetical protein
MKIFGTPFGCRPVKKWDFCIFKGKDLEEVARVDGEASLQWWKGNIDQISSPSYSNLFHGAIQITERLMPTHHISN